MIVQMWMAQGWRLWFVAVSKLLSQVIILARSSREMFQIVRIDWKHFLSRVRFFIREKHPKTRGNSIARASVYLNEPATGRDWSPDTRRKVALTASQLGASDPSNSDNLNGDGGVCAFARACVCDVFAIYDNNNWPRLIMIISTTIFLYFIQITHTDDSRQWVHG